MEKHEKKEEKVFLIRIPCVRAVLLQPNTHKEIGQGELLLCRDDQDKESPFFSIKVGDIEFPVTKECTVMNTKFVVHFLFNFLKKK